MTDKELSKLMQNPHVRRFCESGDRDLAEKYTSMAYMFISNGNAYQEQAYDILKKYGLVLHDVKYFGNRLIAVFDQYNTVLKSMIPDMEAKQRLLNEYGIISDFADLVVNDKVTVRRGDYYSATLYLPREK